MDVRLIFLSTTAAAAAAEPPSAPQNLTGGVVDQNTVMLTWSAPKFLGGRNDTLYRVQCDACHSSVSFVPASERLNETRVLVTGLSPATAHRFLVFAENGASGHDASQFSDITFTTEPASASAQPRPSPASPPSSSTNGLYKYLSAHPSLLTSAVATRDPLTLLLQDWRRR